MKKKKLYNSGSKYAIIFDIFVIAISLFISWIIRSQFRFFTYDIRKFIFLFPWVIVTRLVCHLFFEIYSFSLVTLTAKDIAGLYKYNILPTVLLLFLRFFPFRSQIVNMPLSMIGMEYFFSTTGFVLVRLLINGRKKKMLDSVQLKGYKRRIILWGEVKEIELDIDLEELKRNGVEIMGIVNPNPLYWNSEYNGIRVLGDEKEIEKISILDDRISSVAVLHPEYIAKGKRNHIIEKANELNLEIATIENNRYIRKNGEWLKNV